MRWDLTRHLRAGTLLALVLGTGACQEKLAAPADCPALCPGGFDLVDTVLTPVPSGDTSFAGYVRAGSGSGLRVSYQFPLSEDRAVLRFTKRPDSLEIQDTLKAYTIDSVAFEVALLYRDTSVPNARLVLYRMPALTDSTVTFTDLDTAFTVANTVDSFVLDTVGRYRRVLTGAALARVAIAPADTGILSLGIGLRAAQGTGVRIGNVASSTVAPTFITYVRLPYQDSTVQRTLIRSAQFAAYRSQATEVLDPDLLTVGGVPSARSLLRFNWPSYLRDSAQLIRVSLELLPATPVVGIPGDTAFILARPVLADFGAKSPAVTSSAFAGIDTVLTGQTDTVRIEVRAAASTWQGSNPLPAALLLILSPEASTFTRPTFGSTRTPGFQPRLRVTFARPFPFEDP